MSVPVINSVSPVIGNNDATVPIAIYGESFDAGPTVLLIAGVLSYTLENIIRVDSNIITGDVPQDILPGEYSVVVVNTDTNQDILEDAFRSMYPVIQPDFTSETQDQIRNRILSHMQNEWDTSIGSFPYDIASAFSIEAANVAIRLNEVISLGFVQTSRARWLDALGEQFGLVRTEAVKAIGQVRVYGVDSTIIPVGTQFSTIVSYGQFQSAITFTSTEEGEIAGGTVDVPVQALLAGLSGNVGSSQITRLLSNVAGVSAVDNPSPTSGGSNAENDNGYRVRLLNFVQNPVAGGNKQDYVTWALEVEGVGAATCIPLARGNGTVDVYVLDENLEVDAQLVTDVQNYIAPSPSGEGGGKAPIGADVLIASPALVQISVVVNLVISEGFNAALVEAAVEESITDYINSLPIGTTVFFVRIANAIHDINGVEDYTSLEVNGGTSNISIDEDEKAVADSIAASVP